MSTPSGVGVGAAGAGPGAPGGASGAGGDAHSGGTSGSGIAGFAGADSVLGGHAGNAEAGRENDAGATNDAGASNNAGASNDAGSAGTAEAGSADDERETAYLATFLPGGVSVLSIDPKTGVPTQVPGAAVDVGAHLYAVTVSPTRRFVYTVGADSGDIRAYRIRDDGTLPVLPASSAAGASKRVAFAFEPRERFAYSATTDEPAIQPFKVDAVTGALAASGDPVEVAGGPTYLALDPTGHFLYASLAFEVGIRGYRLDQTSGTLHELAGSAFGKDQAVFGGALVFTPGGAFLYSSGNGLNGFAIDGESGQLSALKGSPFTLDVGSDPQASNLAIDPQGAFLYVSQFLTTNHVSGFSIDRDTGKLSEVLGSPVDCPAPYSLAVNSSGRFIYVGNDTGQLSVFSVDRSNGKLGKVSGSPFTLGGLQPELAFAAGLEH